LFETVYQWSKMCFEKKDQCQRRILLHKFKNKFVPQTKLLESEI
jgi:hypothetical protein